MLEVISLGCVRGNRRLFRDLSFSLERGGFLELRGPNGGGKTSLMRILCGLATPAEGEVRWNGTSIGRLREEYFAAIAYVAHLNGVKDELTAQENLTVSERVAGNAVSAADTERALERVGLSRQRHLAARLLSAGQRRRLALARLLLSRARLWILDEMLTSLDDAGIALARELVAAHLADGGLTIFATHQELDLVSEGAQRIQLS